MNHVVNKIITGLKISKPDRVELNKFLDRPDIQKILNGDEADRLARRRELIAEKAELPGKFKKRQEEAGKAANAAAARFEAAEKEFYAAREANRIAALANDGAGHALGMQIKAIDDELRKGSDPRLEEYYFEIRNLESRARVADNYWMAKEEREGGGMFGRGTYIVDVLANNMDDVIAAGAALEKTRIEVEAMALQALSTAEITAALRKMTDDLIPVLNRLNGMNPPWLDLFNEVRPPNEDGKPAYPYPLDDPQQF